MLEVHARYEGQALADVLRSAGIAGCGGAGFPTYPKYAEPKPILVVNAQESEPGYFIDKWLHQEHAQAFHDLFLFLLEWGVEKIVVGAKSKDRAWFEKLEALSGGAIADCTGRNRVAPSSVSEKVLFSYTDDRYAFGKETALLLVVAGQKIPLGERPGQHGFIVNNSQTLFNLHQALTTGQPNTRKYVHVFGETPKHIFCDMPLGTPCADLLEEAGSSVGEVEAKGFVVVEGGPGWFHRVDPGLHAVSRRTNALLIIDPAFADPNGKDVLSGRGKEGYPRREEGQMAKAPSPPGAIPLVRIPLVDNPELEAVQPAVPCVKVGTTVAVTDLIAEPADHGFSLPCHASIAGTVSAVTETFIEISR